MSDQPAICSFDHHGFFVLEAELNSAISIAFCEVAGGTNGACPNVACNNHDVACGGVGLSENIGCGTVPHIVVICVSGTFFNFGCLPHLVELCQQPGGDIVCTHPINT